MLKSIDILLGLSVVMLVVSMAVTVLTQFVTSVWNSRGRHLQAGLADLLQQIDPNLERKIAESICGTVLQHPMIRDVDQRLGSTIHREEFIKLLMDLGSGYATPSLINGLGTQAQNALQNTLKTNGIEEPAKILDNVRAMALHLELTQPELATDVRHAKALMLEANSKFVAKVNSWFDQTIERVSGRFTFTTRGVTFVCSTLVALIIQLDCLTLINHLSVDNELRNNLVEKAVEMGNKNSIAESIDTNILQQPQQQEPQTQSPQKQQHSQTQQQDFGDLLQLGIINVPKSLDEWRSNWQKINPLGVVLSIFLLSLGAPFWFSALQNLLKLRSTLSGKDDDQRLQRQTSQVSQSSSPDNASVMSGDAPETTGERGNLG